jgi:hypothetical protein
MHLDIFTEIIISSQVSIDHNLQGQEKVLALCSALGATTYVNSIGGMELYSKRVFDDRGIKLKFLRSKPYIYEQFSDEFVACLSVIDILMFNSITNVQSCIKNNYEMF